MVAMLPLEGVCLRVVGGHPLRLKCYSLRVQGFATSYILVSIVYILDGT